MPVYKYWGASHGANETDHFELVAPNETNIDNARLSLIRSVTALTNDFIQAEADSSEEADKAFGELHELVSQIAVDDMSELPVPLVAPSLAVEKPDSVMVDPLTMLVSSIKGDKAAPTLKRVDYKFVFGQGDPVLARGAKLKNKWFDDKALNRYGCAVEARPDEATEHDYTLHLTLGSLSSGDVFVPFLTVLNPSHPIRLAARRAVTNMEDYRRRRRAS